MSAHSTVVPARTGLVGHPSDAFGGAVLALPVPELAATVNVEPSHEILIGDRRFDDLDALVAGPHEGDSMLLTATVAQLVSWLRGRGSPPPPDGFALTWRTTIPRAAGLAGSSALVIGALRALSRAWDVAIPDDVGPQLALAVEVDSLGIAAGPQDRIVQWHGAPVLMEFGVEPWSVSEVHPPAPLELLVCWTDTARQPSHVTHAPLQERRDEPDVRRRMGGLAELARAAATAVRDGDIDEVGRCMNVGFEHRRALLSLDPVHVELVEGLWRLGAAATYTGSGGAVVALASDLTPLRAWANGRGLGNVTTRLA